MRQLVSIVYNSVRQGVETWLLDNSRKEVTKMELYVLLEFLKLIFFVFEIFRYFDARKREKALIASLERYNQHLKLEKKIKENP